MPNTLENLCYYDTRNPNGALDVDVIAAHQNSLRSGRILKCHCDNCFYGRTELAEELLRLSIKGASSLDTALEDN